MSLVCGVNRIFRTEPRLNRGVGSQAAIDDLAPADDPLSLAGEESFDPLDEITLQFVLILEAFRLNASLAQRAAFPVAPSALIATDMYYWRWEYLDYFRQDVFDELKRLVVARTVIGSIVPIAPFRRLDSKLPIGAGEFGKAP